jgi:hypothetical protein
LIYPLDRTARLDESLAGGKAVVLGGLIEAGYRVPLGFCIAETGYEQFVERSGLTAPDCKHRPAAALRFNERKLNHDWPFSGLCLDDGSGPDVAGPVGGR